MASTKISVSKALELHGLGYSDLMDSLVPACCNQGCEVEPDGSCEHGNDSVLLEMGMI